MKIEARNFPLYELIDRLGRPGAETARECFASAQTGGDDDKYMFALGIYPVASPENNLRYSLPGATEQMADETLRSCLAVFEEIGIRGHFDGAWMSAYCYANGHGCTKDATKAATWIQRAEDIAGGANARTKELRDLLAQHQCRVRDPSRGHQPNV